MNRLSPETIGIIKPMVDVIMEAASLSGEGGWPSVGLTCRLPASLFLPCHDADDLVGGCVEEKTSLEA